MRVLLVEDDVAQSQIASRFLKRLGAEVDVACSGLGAIAAVELNKYDCILMDLMMPAMGGVDATRCIRSLENGRKVLIVAVTAMVNKQQMKECFRAGMDEFIPKPFRKDDLEEVFERRLQRLEAVCEAN